MASSRKTLYILCFDNRGLYKKPVNGYLIDEYTFTAKDGKMWYYYDLLSGVLLKDNSGKYVVPCEKTTRAAIDNYYTNGGAWCCREIRTSPDYEKMVHRFIKVTTVL